MENNKIREREYEKENGEPVEGRMGRGKYIIGK